VIYAARIPDFYFRLRNLLPDENEKKKTPPRQKDNNNNILYHIFFAQLVFHGNSDVDIVVHFERPRITRGDKIDFYNASQH